MLLNSANLPVCLPCCETNLQIPTYSAFITKMPDPAYCFLAKLLTLTSKTYSVSTLRTESWFCINCRFLFPHANDMLSQYVTSQNLNPVLPGYQLYCHEMLIIETKGFWRSLQCKEIKCPWETVLWCAKGWWGYEQIRFGCGAGTV